MIGLDLQVTQMRAVFLSMLLLLENSHFSLVLSTKNTRTSQNPLLTKSLQPVWDWFELPAQDTEDTHIDNNAKGSRNQQSGSSLVKSAERLNRHHREHHQKSMKRSKTASVRKKGGEKKLEKNTVSSVTNLSQHKLIGPQVSLLEKGLKFIPSRHKVDKVKLLADLSEWERRMWLAEFFYDEEDSKADRLHEEDEKFTAKKKSTFTPSSGRDKCLGLYIELVKDDVVANLRKSNKLNIPKKESEAFYELLHNKEIIIRPADKGSGIVVVDKEEYIKSLEEEMENSSSYEETDYDRTEEIHKKGKRLVSKMNRDGAISDELKQYLLARYVQKGKLKGNPKLHKQNAPYRTIVSGIDTPTEKLAEVAEHELYEFVEKSPSYIRDTTDFILKLQEIEEPLPENALLFCFDVCKLYPSIPRREGLAACEETLSARSRPLVDKEREMEIIRTVLYNSTFGFGDRNYIQKEGVAIGSRLGKNFAYTYMRKWDEELLKARVTPLFYKRFTDDRFGVWTGSEEEPKEFAAFAKLIHGNIKVELRYDPKQIEFLDTLVKIKDGHIYTDLYIKPTDKQLYLNSSSCHPSNTKEGLAYGLGLRIKRICEKEEDYRKHRQDLKIQLRRRGYSGKLTESQLGKVDKLETPDLLNSSRKKDFAESATSSYLL